LQAQVAPQVHFGPQVQGWQEHCRLAHWLVISRLLLRPLIRTLKN
jgi:cytochrome b